MSEQSAVSLEELSSTKEWRSLGAYTKQILSEALESRNLLAAIAKHTQSKVTADKIAFGLLKDQDVLAVVLKYALGISTQAPQEAGTEGN